MAIKQVTIESHYVLVNGALLDLGKVWSGSLHERSIRLLFIGGGKVEIEREDGGEMNGGVSSIWLEPHYFDQLKAYLMVNLKPIKIA